MKIHKDKYHIRLEMPNGAAWSMPIELIKGIRDGLVEDSRYYHASEFLSNEGKQEVTPEEIRELFEEAIK